MPPGDFRQRGKIADFHGQAARRLEERGPGARIDRRFECRRVERIEKAGLDAEFLEQAAAHGPHRIVDVVGDQHRVARPQHRKQGAGDGGDARGIEHRSRRARLERGQRLGQRPLRRRAAAAIKEAAVGVGLRASLERGHAIVEVRARAPDRGIDHGPGRIRRAGPFAPTSAGDEAGCGESLPGGSLAIAASFPCRTRKVKPGRSPWGYPDRRPIRPTSRRRARRRPCRAGAWRTAARRR